MNHYVEVYERATNAREELIGPFDERQAGKVLSSVLGQIDIETYSARPLSEEQLSQPMPQPC